MMLFMMLFHLELLIELVKIPIEVSNAPTKEQVEKFASLVSDSSKRPIYLHSKEGVWRTSAMVSRWREYTAHSAPQYVSNQALISSDMLTEKDTDLLQSTSPKENNEKTQSNRTLSIYGEILLWVGERQWGVWYTWRNILLENGSASNLQNFGFSHIIFSCFVIISINISIINAKNAFCWK